MLFSQTDKEKNYFILTMLGVASWTLPLISPYFILLPIITLIISMLLLWGHSSFKIVTVGNVLVLFFILSGVLDPSFGTSLIIVLTFLIFSNSLTNISLVIILLQTSLISSVEANLASAFYNYHYEVIAPGFTVCFLLFFFRVIGLLKLLICLILILAVYFLAIHFIFEPHISMALIGLVPLLGCYQISGANEKKMASISLLLFLLLTLISWYPLLPNFSKGVWVFLPNNDSAPESKYYKNYVEVLNFSGIPAKEAVSINDIPDYSFVLLPWLTSGFPLKINEFKAAAKKGKWTVILSGEHTNYGGVRDTVNKVTGVNVLRGDLTVPRNNTNISGFFRQSGVVSWNSKSAFNRGASVNVEGFRHKVLLTGDGWWTESDIGEWLWVGDYVFRTNDHMGRVPLALSFYEQDIKWVVFGDNSFLLSKYVLSNPSILKKAIYDSTLWPAFIKDIFILLLIIFFFTKHNRSFLLILFLGFLFLLAFHEKKYVTNLNGSYSDLYIESNSFHRRSFASTIIKTRKLLTSNWLFERAGVLSGELKIPKKDTILFLQVEDEVSVGLVEISGCRRYGRLLLKSGIKMNDAQSCLVEGPAEIMVGDKFGASIILVSVEGVKLLLIFDQHFLIDGSPKKNSEFIIDFINDRV